MGFSPMRLVAKLQAFCHELQRAVVGEGLPDPGRDSAPTPAIYFAGVVAFYALFELVMNEWALSGEMFAEMGVNYFYHAESRDILERLFATDAGYVPLLQRLIAAGAASLHVSIERVPFVYTWVAILLSGAIVAAFSLAHFRSLIRSDGARALACVAVLLSANWQTATFVNFTHFNLFLIAAFVATSLVARGDDAPLWAWCLPLLMVSKPYVLTVLPAAAVALLVAKPRYRRILLVSILAAAAQMVRMLLSRQQGVAWDGAQEYTILEKLWVGLATSLAFLGEYTIGANGSAPAYAIGPWVFVTAGLIVIAAAAVTLWFRPHPAMAAVLVGLSILFPTFLLNSFVFTNEFNPDLQILRSLAVYRHTMPGFYSAVLVVIGLLAVWTEGSDWKFGSRSITSGTRHATLFLIWMLAAGWVTTGAANSKPPPFPETNHSRWQLMAESIQDRRRPVCVPIDPLGWIYGRGCRLLAPIVYRGGGAFKPLPAHVGIDLLVPAGVTTSTLMNVGVPLRLVRDSKHTIQLKLIVDVDSGEQQEFTGERTLGTSGGLILLSGPQPAGASGVRRARIFSDTPVEFFFLEGEDHPAIEWMGR
jgi:hypothetical protein